MANLSTNFFLTLFGGPPVELDGGNRNTPPINPQYEVGTYQYIQPVFLHQGVADEIDNVAPEFQNWGDYPVDGYGLSGLTGGGANAAPEVDVSKGGSLFFDPTTGLYYDINPFG